jgi:hypothetical protein
MATVALAACGPGALPAPSVPDDPATVRVIVFMRSAVDDLTVWFPRTPDNGGGSASSVLRGSAVACEVVPAGATVAVIAAPGVEVLMPLYAAHAGDADQVLWVEAAADGELTHGEGRPDWGTTTPQCPGTAQ